MRPRPERAVLYCRLLPPALSSWSPLPFGSLVHLAAPSIWQRSPFGSHVHLASPDHLASLSELAGLSGGRGRLADSFELLDVLLTLLDCPDNAGPMPDCPGLLSRFASRIASRIAGLCWTVQVLVQLLAPYWASPNLGQSEFGPVRVWPSPCLALSVFGPVPGIPATACSLRIRGLSQSLGTVPIFVPIFVSIFVSIFWARRGLSQSCEKHLPPSDHTPQGNH